MKQKGIVPSIIYSSIIHYGKDIKLCMKKYHAIIIELM